MTDGSSSVAPRNCAALALASLPLIVFFMGAFLAFGHSVDDLYITLRYAANLYAGHGPVFNVGERVEGYSSPLHLLLSTALLGVAPGMDLFFKSKIVSVLFGLAALVQMRRMAPLCGLDWRSAITAQILLALNMNFALASVNGMETSLYAFVLLVAVTQFLRENETDPSGERGWLSGLLLFLALLARPDTLLSFAALLGLRLAWGKGRRASLSGTVRWAAAFLVPFALLIAVRLWYYGSPLSNTYYAKSVSLGYGLWRGFPYLWHGLTPFNRHQSDWGALQATLTGHGSFAQTLFILSAVLFWGLALAGLVRARARRGAQVCGAVVGAFSLFVLLSGGDWMSGWRFMAAALPFFTLLQIHGLQTLAAAAERRRSGGATRAYAPEMRRAVYAVAIAFWSLCFLRAPHISWAAAGFSTDGEALMIHDEDNAGPFLVSVGNYIRDRLKGAKRISYSEMGYASFINLDTTFLDTHGLTNRELAHQPRQYKSRVGFTDHNWRNPGGILHEFLRRERPDAILVVTKRLPEPEPPLRGPVLGDYRQVRSVGTVTDVKMGDHLALVYLAPHVFESPLTFTSRPRMDGPGAKAQGAEIAAEKPAAK